MIIIHYHGNATVCAWMRDIKLRSQTETRERERDGADKMTVERLSGLVRISRRTFSLKFTIFIFQAQNQRRVGFAVWGDWERGRRQSHAGEQGKTSSCRRIDREREREKDRGWEACGEREWFWMCLESQEGSCEMICHEKRQKRMEGRDERGRILSSYSSAYSEVLSLSPSPQHSNLQNHTVTVKKKWLRKKRKICII